MRSVERLKRSRSEARVFLSSASGVGASRIWFAYVAKHTTDREELVAGQPHSSAWSPLKGKTARRVAAIDLSSQSPGSYP
jgi:hypothetical protein